MENNKHKQIISISFAENMYNGELLSRAKKKLAKQFGDSGIVETGSGSLHTIVGGSRDNLYLEKDNFAAAVNLNLYNSENGRRFEIHELLKLKPEEFSLLAPPLGLFLSQGDRLTAATDICGLQHLYGYRGEGWAAVSSSSLLLGYTVGAELDYHSLAQFALAGNYLEDYTAFENIFSLPPGCFWVMKEGELVAKNYFSLPENLPPFSSLEEAAAEGTKVIGRQVEICLKAYPEVSMELSGGVDSRMIISSIPQSAYPHVTALTIGSPATGDLKVAKNIAHTLKLKHTVVELPGLAEYPVEEFLALSEQSAFFKDFAANPISGGIIAWVETQFPQSPRLSGQNGEFARGFYYGGQVEQPAATPALAEKLANWRIIMNDCVNPALFQSPFLEEARKRTIEVIKESFSGYTGSWLNTTDTYYLTNRMRNWAGNSFSGSSQNRVFLCPFFHKEFLLWARRLPVEYKKNSKILIEVMKRLSPLLVKIPLDTGILPTDITNPSLGAKIKKGITFGKKFFFKLTQKTGLIRKSNNIGAEGMAQRILASLKKEPAFKTILQDIEILNSKFLDELFEPGNRIDPSTLGFLLILYWTKKYLKE